MERKIKTIKLVFGSSDGKKISNGHMGDSENFYIYELHEDGSYEFLCKKENTFKEMEHAGQNKMKLITELLSEAELLIARQKSPNYIKIAEKTKFQPLIVSSSTILNAIKEVGEQFNMLYELCKRRKQGEKNIKIAISKALS